MIDWRQWHAEPLLVTGLVLLGWIYGLAAGPWRARLAPGEAWPARAAAYFYSGLFLSYLAVGSPLERVGGLYLFSAHIGIQMAILYPAAGLLLRGLPPWMIDAALGRPVGRALASVAFRPWIAGAIFVLVISAGYAPRLLNWILIHPTGQALEHGVDLAVGVLFWWPLLSPSRLFPPVGFGGRMLYLFALEVALTGVFTFLLMAEHPMYPTYELAPRLILDLTPESDQVLGGILLSGISSLVLVGALGVTFWEWAKESR